MIIFKNNLIAAILKEVTISRNFSHTELMFKENIGPRAAHTPTLNMFCTPSPGANVIHGNVLTFCELTQQFSVENLQSKFVNRK